MQAGDIMHPDVKTVSGEATFTEAAAVMHDNKISSVLVVEGGRPVGIVTERDVVNLVAGGLDPVATKVSGRMTRDLATVDRRADLADAARTMAELRIRHLPVMDKGELVGIISIRDLTTWAVEELTGGHELADIQRGSVALTAAVEAKRRR